MLEIFSVVGFSLADTQLVLGCNQEHLGIAKNVLATSIVQRLKHLVYKNCVSKMYILTGVKTSQTLPRQSLAKQDAGAKHRSRFIQRVNRVGLHADKSFVDSRLFGKRNNR